MGDAISLGAVSFYDFLKAGNAGKKVFVCNGSACLVAGTQKKLHDDLAKSFTDEEIGHICCLGRCHQGGAFQFEGKNYSGQNEAALKSLFQSGEGDCVDRYAVGSTLNPPMLTAAFPGIEEYYAPLREVFAKGPDCAARGTKGSEIARPRWGGISIALQMAVVP